MTRAATHTTVIKGMLKGGPAAIEVRIGPALKMTVTIDTGDGPTCMVGEERDTALGAVFVQLAHRSYRTRTDHDGVTTFDLGEIR